MASSPLSEIPLLERLNGRLPAGAVRSHLRRLILDGTLPPGTILPQVELARRLGVSRTPLREALRMLQEEGLIEAEPNRRARVTGFDPSELDTLYATRVLLEALGIELTVPRLEAGDMDLIEGALEDMRRTAATRGIEQWEEAHARFHALLVCHAGDQLRRSIRNQADQSERYRRLYQVAEPRAWTVGDAEHEAIVNACRERDPREAAVQLAQHLARTALSIMAQLAPATEPRHVRSALSMVVREQVGVS